MIDHTTPFPNLRAEQETIRAKCFHPTGTFVEFGIEEVEQSIAQRFEKITSQYADRVAIETSDRILTYGELNQAVNGVAHALIDRLGEQLKPVIVISDHGPDAMIAALAVFKAGKILIAIDPTFPANRAEHIRQDSGAIAIVTDSQNVPLAASLATEGFPLLNIDSWTQVGSRANPTINLSSNDMAEIRYSSGSTGEPKGIARSHRKLLHSTRSSIRSAHICPEDRLVGLKRLSFGSNDTLKGLLAGATVCPFDLKKHSLADLTVFLNRQRITYYASSSSIFRSLTSEWSETNRIDSVRLLQLGAEPLGKSDVEAFKKFFSDDCILMHRLSCGEAGNICQYFVDKHTVIDTPLVPAGYPVEDKKIVLLDENRQKVATGEPGEIAVQSRYLFSEYWNKPAMTDAKLLSTGASGEEPMYLTGDMGRILPDGRLLYLGRKDLEVKVRGCKVALPEIEATLREFSSIKDAAVKAWGDNSADLWLAAYVVTRGETETISRELPGLLRAKLPDYMIPSRFVFLERLPSINGKIDRAALPAPGERQPELAAGFVAPRTPMEKMVAEIWSTVLQVERVGIHDNFFDLGGHSLAASRVVSRVLKHFQLQIPLQSLFQAPTIAQMAALITEHEGNRLQDDELEQILDELESLSDEQAQRMLAEANNQQGSGNKVG